MGRASSAKKVARAARAGGAKASRQRRNLGFPAIIAAVVVLGLALVVWAVVNSQEVLANDTAPRAAGSESQGDHWHAAYGFNICGQFQPPLEDVGEDREGIHTHSDGVIHIHPFLRRSAGERATLGKFLDQVDVQVSGSSITLPDGKTYKEGETSCNGEPATVKVAKWTSAQAAASGAPPDEVFDSDFSGIRFTEDGAAFTIAFLPEGAAFGAPPTSGNLAQLGAVDAGAAPPDEGGGTGGTATTGGTGATGGVPGSAGGDVPPPPGGQPIVPPPGAAATGGSAGGGSGTGRVVPPPAPAP